MEDVQGLEKAVWNQFEADFCGLRDTANALNDSWKHTATLHARVNRFAKQSALASVDPGSSRHFSAKRRIVLEQIMQES